MEERLKALKLAMEREAEAKAFYLEASRKMTNNFAQDMFQSLASDEERHLRTVKAVYERLSKERAWPQQVTSIGDTVTVKTISPADVRSIELAAEDLEVSREILKLGIEREEWSMDFYHELAKKATDPFEKRFFIALEHEERGHYLTLWDYREFLEDPESWFAMKEGFRLDAG